MLEMRRRLAELPGLPNVTTGRADEFFEQLRARMDSTDQYVHTWDGELYLELHRGTYTSQAYNKRMNRKLELLYREAEWLGVLGCALCAGWAAYRQKQLHDGWKIILRNQFHDIIPGSSIREVYEDSRQEYEEAWRIGESVRDEAARSLTVPEADGGLRSFILLNGAPWRRTGLVRLPGAEDAKGVWQNAAGHVLLAQKSGDGWWVRAADLPPMGWGTVSFHAGEAGSRAESPFRYEGNAIETPFYHIEWNGQGHLTSIYDKRENRQVLAPGAAGNVLQVFEDKPKGRHEAWDIDIFYREKMRTVDDLASVGLEEQGPLRAVVRFRWNYMRSVIDQRMIVYADSRRIDFATRVDWHEQRQLMKVAFPVDIRATEATYDIQFGNARRPTHWNTSWDYAKFETVGHQWADLSEGGYGVSLLNDCKYGYDIKDNVMRLSLIKSAMVPDDKADQGEHVFTYALLPHRGDWREGGTVREAWELNNPITAIAGVPVRPQFSLFGLSAENVMIDAVKKAEDEEAVVVRLHEFMGVRGPVELRCGLAVASWLETDLLERPLGEVAESGEIRFTLKPYEIKTLMLYLR
jgi:alpha-mannosidase